MKTIFSWILGQIAPIRCDLHDALRKGQVLAAVGVIAEQLGAEAIKVGARRSYMIDRGWIAFADGRVAGYGESNAPAGSADAGGDLIMPGLIELHTDHLEAHYVPRPKVFWDPIAAVVSYDGQLATSGITTVLDSLRVWREDGAEEVDGRAGVLAAAIGAARDANLLRAEHFLHLRCEIPMPRVGEEATELAGRADVRLISLMDHTPGQRQFRDEVKLRDYYRRKGAGKTDAELDELFARRFAYQNAYAATNM